MSALSERIREAANSSPMYAGTVEAHIVNAFNSIAETYWADMSVPEDQARTFLLLVAEALE